MKLKTNDIVRHCLYIELRNNDGDFRTVLPENKKTYKILREDGFIETTAGKGCYVSVRNQDFYLEEQQKKIEGCLNDAIEIARMSGIPLDKLVSLLTLLYEEN